MSSTDTLNWKVEGVGAALWLGVGEGVFAGVEVGAGVGFGVGVVVGVGLGVGGTSKYTAIEPGPLIVAVVDGETLLVIVIKFVLLDH